MVNLWSHIGLKVRFLSHYIALESLKQQNVGHKKQISKPKLKKKRTSDIEYDTEELGDEHFFDISDDSETDQVCFKLLLNTMKI